jgi:hypothetical protein
VGPNIISVIHNSLGRAHSKALCKAPLYFLKSEAVSVTI